MAFTLAGTNAGEAVAVGGRATRSSGACGSRPRAGATATVATYGAGTTVRWLRLAADPSSDDLVLAIGDVDGTTGRVTTVPTTAAPAPGERSRPSTRRARSATSPVTAPSTSPGTRSSARATCSSPTRTPPGCGASARRTAGSTFGSPRAVDELEAAYWVRLERRPGGEIDLAAQDESNDLRAWRWNGYDWLRSTTPIALSANLEPGSGHDVEPFALASVVAPTPVPPRRDFNRDGRNDLMWHNSVTGGIYGSADAAPPGPPTCARRASPTPSGRSAPRRLRPRRHPRRARHHVATGDLYAWFLDGTVAVGGQYLTPRTVIDTQWQIRDAADLNGDGSPDLLWHHQARGELYVWFMDGLVQKSGAFDLIPATRHPLAGPGARRLQRRREGRHPLAPLRHRRALRLADERD